MPAIPDRAPSAASTEPPETFTAGQLLAHLDALLNETEGHRQMMSECTACVEIHRRLVEADDAAA